MRVIKFRGLTEAGFVYGDLLHCSFRDGEGVGIKDTVNHVNDGYLDIIPTRIINGTEGQFTGLFDSSGVEIYEGDIISDHVGVGVVEYVEKYAGFRVNYGDGRAKWFYDYNLKGERESIEVLGNVHENPSIVLKEWD